LAERAHFFKKLCLIWDIADPVGVSSGFVAPRQSVRQGEFSAVVPVGAGFGFKSIVSRHMLDRGREIIHPHMLSDDLAKPFIPVMPLATRRLRLQICRPEHFQRGLLPAQPCRNDRVNIHRDEPARHTLAPVREEAIDLLECERFHLGGSDQVFRVEHATNPRDRALRASFSRDDLSIRVFL